MSMGGSIFPLVLMVMARVTLFVAVVAAQTWMVFSPFTSNILLE